MEQQIFKITKMAEVKGDGFYMHIEAEDDYIGAIAHAVVAYALANEKFYHRLLEFLDDAKKGR